MIHLMLSGRVDLPSADPVGRGYWGWWDGMSDEECYRVNRWRWKLGERADSESFALFSAWNNAKTSKLVRSAIEIDHIEPRDSDGFRSLVGRVLKPGHPVYDTYVGQVPPVVGARNPVTYFPSPCDP